MKNDLIGQPRVSACTSTFLVLLALATFILQPSSCLAQGTAFIYQGRFTDNGTPYTGNVEIQATLWDAVSGGSQSAANIPAQVVVGVTNGLFVLPLNFGENFPGANRWLQLEVRTTIGAFTPLTPRQPLTPAPYAITAANLSGPVAAANITGTIPLGQLPAALVTNGASGVNLSGNLSGTFSGNGAGVTGVDLLNINGQGAISFATNYGTLGLASSPGVGSGSYSVTAADVNGDGKADLISADLNSNTLTVLTNNGSGGFVLASSPGVGYGPVSVTAADVNGDGKADLISANYATNTLTVLTNNGSGSFVLASSPGVGYGPSSVTAADVNGDGKVDLISANYLAGNGNTLKVLTNNGSGGFVLASSPGVGSGPFSVTAADVNGDGKADLISANNGEGNGNTLTVLTNNGSGGFVLASSPGVGSGPSTVTAADVNGDGKVDLISANNGGGSGNTLTVLLNTAQYTGAFSGTVSGNGSGLTSLNANHLASGTVPAAALNNAWKITGNAGTTPGPHALGTTDNQPLELKVNNQRGLRLEPTANNVFHSNIVNVVEGSSVNLVGAGVYGATIGGGGALNYFGIGGTNRVEADFGTIGGGLLNTIQSSASTATISGGGFNTIQTSASGATIGGGSQNTIQPAFYATIGGGRENTIQTNAQYATLGGGSQNTIHFNTISATIGGGRQNTIERYAEHATIGGGYGSTIQPGANYATIPGGYLNSAAGFAFAAGRQAKANHIGAFVWADSQDADFASTGNNQFCIRAAGGVRLSDSTPQLSFGQTVRQMITLYDSGVNSTFGIGVQGSTFYQRAGTGSGFAWYQGGIHHNAQNNPGGGGTVLMRLDASGNLYTTGAVNPPSDRNAKMNFASVNGRDVLERLATIPVQSWNYKADSTTRHIGPMAQDFYAAFNLGSDDKHIATVDADGVALAAIQGLNQKLEEKDAELQALKRTVAELKAAFDQLGRAQPSNPVTR